MSQRTLLRRVAKLEDALLTSDDRIPVYVEDEKDLPARVDELIAAGALAAADRPRCVFWLAYRRYAHWQHDDEITRRLNVQIAIDTPCAKWLAEAREARAQERTPK